MTSKIEKAIIKYITKSATASDLDLLSEWIKNPVNEKLFKDYVLTHYAITFCMNNPDTNKVLDRLLKEIKKEKSLVYRLKKEPIYKYAAAAIVIGILTTTYFYKDNIFNSSVEPTPTIVNTNTKTIQPGTDKAILTLENGSQIALEKGASIQTQNASSNGDKIIYEAQKSKTKEIEYNYLTIPRGGQFFVKLSDGTQVWLNSESKLKYPVSFKEGETRQVELVYGEAYFDVSPSSEHKGSHFKVFNQSQEVNVIGTEFNIKAYKDERNIYTTLVEGKVDVSIQSQKHSLRPNQQLNLDTETKTSRITMVDVYNEISWKDGVFSFENKSLKEMMTVLSRWYDVEVIIKNKSIETQEFIGILRKNQNIEEILTSIKNFGVIKNFTVTDKKVILE